MSKPILVGAIVVIIIAAGLYYFFVAQKRPAPVTPVEPIEKKEQGLGGQLFEKTGNPSQKVPETNPFKEVETNPLQGTNPFEGGYRNPFE